MPALTGWGAGTVPMAPSTAVLTILAGAAIVLRAGLSPRRDAVRLATILAVIGATAALLLLAQRIRGAYWTVEHLGLRIDGTILGVPIGYISPITAFCFLLANLVLLALPSDLVRRSFWRVTLALSGAGLAGVMGFALLLAHAFGVPLLWRAAAIPPALNTAVVLLIMGLSLLVLSGRERHEPRVSPADGSRSGRVLVLIFIVFVAVSVTGGYAYYRQEEREVRREAESQLEVVAKLKAIGLTQWRTERLGDGAVMQHSTVLSAAFERFLQAPADSVAEALIRDWLRSFEGHHQYDRAFVFDAHGMTRMSLTPEPPSRLIVEEAATVLRTGTVTLRDFYLDERDHRPHLAVLAPILSHTGAARPIGVLALRIDPDTYLQPYVGAWPATSATAEALLVRRDGDHVVFLSDLRFERNAQLRRRISLDDLQILAVQAVRGRTGGAEGLDYRGEQVLGALYRIPDSPWYLIARMDVAEFRAEMWGRLWLVAAFTIVLVAGGASTLGFIRRSQRARFYRKRAELTSAPQESEERLRLALVAADQGLYDLDVLTGEALVSPEYATMLGYDAAEFRETNDAWIERMHMDNRPTVVAAYRNYIAGVNDEYRVEFRQRTKSGDWKWILSLGKVASRAEDGAPLRMLGTHTDITARKTAELRSQRLAQLYAALSQCNQAIVRCVDEAALFPQICRDIVVFGGMQAAWIGLVDDVTGQVRRVAAFGGGLLADAVADPLAEAAIRDERTVWCNDARNEQQAYHPGGTLAGVTSAAIAALPLCREGRVVGVLTVCASSVGAFDEDNRALFTEMATDISFALDNFARDRARREAEENLRESLERFELANRATFNVIWDWDIQTGALWWNHNFYTAFGYRHEEVEPTVEALTSRIHPDDRDRIDASLHQAVVSRVGTWLDEYRLRRSDGTYAVVVDRGHISRNADGCAMRMIGAMEDVTARKEAQTKMAEQLVELRRWYNATLGREGRVREIKAEVNALLSRLGEPPRYANTGARDEHPPAPGFEW